MSLQTLIDYEADSEEEKDDRSSHAHEVILLEKKRSRTRSPEVKILKKKDVHKEIDAEEDFDSADSSPPSEKIEDLSATSNQLNDSRTSELGVAGRKTKGAQEFTTKLLGTSVEDITLPPPTTARCSRPLQDKISNWYSRMLETGLDMNYTIEKRKHFRNPSIYEKLVEFIDIDEKGSNYPPELYDPHRWGPESMYEVLAKAQKVEMEQREKDKKAKVEFVTGVAKKTPVTASDGSLKRKSKWDLTVDNKAAIKVPTIPVMRSSTMIPAVGTLKKSLTVEKRDDRGVDRSRKDDRLDKPFSKSDQLVKQSSESR